MREEANISTDVSIVVPSYRGEPFLDQIIGNLKHFHEENYEIIFVENGPKGSLQEQLTKKLPKAKYFYIQDASVSAARNLGVAKSTRNFIQFLDVDDTISPDKLRIQLEYAVENDLDLVHSNWRYINHYHKEIVEEPWQSGDIDLIVSILNFSWHPLHSYLLRKKCIAEAGGFDQTYQTSHEDMDLIMAFLINCRTGYVEGNFTDYHRYEGHQSSSFSRGLDYWQDRQQFILKYCQQIHELHDDRRNLLPYLRQFMFSLIRNLAKFNFDEAIKLYSLLKEVDPNFYPDQESRSFRFFYKVFGYRITEITIGVWHKFVPDKYSQHYELKQE